MNIQDKLDYLQDIRYCLLSEINAYRVQRKTAALLKSKGIKTDNYNSENFSVLGMFEQKIKLVKQLIKEYIVQEREINKLHE